jgi:hypothetical protein
MKKKIVWIASWFWLAVVFVAAPAAAQRGPEAPTRQCPLITKEIHNLVKATVRETCLVGCKGCGCKGGTGFRAKTGQCVGFAEILSKCGPPPHSNCVAECFPTLPSCARLGIDWLKALTAGAGITLLFVPSEVPDTATPKDQPIGPADVVLPPTSQQVPQ